MPGGHACGIMGPHREFKPREDLPQAELFAPLDVATPAPGVELQLDIFGGAKNAKGDPHLKINAGSTDLFEVKK